MALLVCASSPVVAGDPPSTEAEEGIPPARTIDETDPAFWGQVQRHVAPLPAGAYRLRAGELLARGTFDAARHAIVLLEHATRLHGDDAVLWALHAEGLAAPHRWVWDRDEPWLDLAARALERARGLDAHAVEVLRASGLLAMLDNRLDDAEAVLRQALALRPDDVEGLLLLGALLRLGDRFPEAYDVYDQVLSAAPEDWRGYAGLGDVYRDDRWYQEALTLYRRAGELGPEAFQPRFGEAMVYQRIDYHPQARRLLQQLIVEFPDSADLALLAAATTHMLEKRYDRALRELEQISLGGARGLSRGSILYRVGLCRLHLGELEEAGVAFQTVLDDYPDARDGSDYGPLVQFGAAMRLASIHEDRGRPEAAAEVLQGASRHPEAPLSLQLELAHKLQSYRLFDAAAEVLRRALEGEEADDSLYQRIRARVELARSLGEEERRGEEVRRRLEEIEGDVEREGSGVDCFEMARGSALAGATEEALAWLTRALERGYRAYDRIRQEPDLRPVRALPGYKELVRGQ